MKGEHKANGEDGEKKVNGTLDPEVSNPGDFSQALYFPSLLFFFILNENKGCFYSYAYPLRRDLAPNLARLLSILYNLTLQIK